MGMFNEAYGAVPLGEDIIKEYVMYTYDVPVSRLPRPLLGFLYIRQKYLRF
jgi:hypothetical protein